MIIIINTQHSLIFRKEIYLDINTGSLQLVTYLVGVLLFAYLHFSVFSKFLKQIRDLLQTEEKYNEKDF